MRKKFNTGVYSFWMWVLLVGVLGQFSCSTSTPAVRIKADKSRSMKVQSNLNKSEDTLNQGVLSISSGPKQTKEELLAVQVNQLLNYYVKAEDLIAEGNFVEAEEQILQATTIVESPEVWLVLIKIYEKTGNKTKVDSCKKLLNSLKPIISPEKVPID